MILRFMFFAPKTLLEECIARLALVTSQALKYAHLGDFQGLTRLFRLDILNSDFSQYLSLFLTVIPINGFSKPKSLVVLPRFGILDSNLSQPIVLNLGILKSFGDRKGLIITSHCRRLGSEFHQHNIFGRVILNGFANFKGSTAYLLCFILLSRFCISASGKAQLINHRQYQDKLPSTTEQETWFANPLSWVNWTSKNAISLDDLEQK